jgi:hypothetical protein
LLTSKTDKFRRGLVFRRSGLPVHFGVSTPLLLIPFGIVPSNDVSLLFRSVTGNPEVRRAIPAIPHPDVIIRDNPLNGSAGTSYRKLVKTLWRTSNAERPRLSDGFTGSGKPAD